MRIREWQDLVRQLSGQLDDLGGRGREPRKERPRRQAPREGDAVNADLVHKSVLAGLLSQIGVRDDRTAAPAARGGRPTPRRGAVEFIGARQLRFSVFPGLGAGEEAAGGAHVRRARRDLAALRADERGHRPRLGGGRSRATS